MYKIFRALFLTVFLLGTVGVRGENVVSSPRTTINFNDDWEFALVEKGVERAESVENLESPDRLKIGDALIPEKVGESKTVHLPHDWAISGPFDTDPNLWGGQGKLPWRGVGWYTKKLNVPDTNGKTYIIDFGGCMAFPEVYINGKYAGGWDYGYVGFQVDISEFLTAGENTIQVRCDTRRHGSRWYPGAGIYRPIRLITTTDRAWLKPGDVTITTPKAEADEAEVVVQVMFDKSELLHPFNCTGTVTIKDAQGKVVGQEAALIHDVEGREFRFRIANPTRWDVTNPYLYTATIRITSEGGCIEQEDGSRGLFGVQDLDEVRIPFGIRKIEWTADDGFHLNGRRVQLYGVDLHHDQGILGAAAHPAAIERQLQIMKNMGVNAIRTSHNPASPEFMDACDRLGLIVWDELFDKWDATADLLEQEYFDDFTARQVRQIVNRDKNRPSVCVWSIGNEIWDIEQNVKGGSNPNLDAPRRVKHVADCFRQFDPSRLVGMGCFVEGSCGADSHVRDSLDVSGWNYGAKYQEAHVRYPKMPLLYTESASAVSSRGYYELVEAAKRFPGWFHPLRKDDYNKETLQVDGYDLISANGPRDIPDVDFDRMERDRYVAGEFVWTGFDYIGEPTPFDKQAKSSYFGIVDLVGLPKDRFFLYRSYWNPNETTVHILPHWNWDGKTHPIVPVYVYTNGDSAELFLNGKSLGRKTKIQNVTIEPTKNLAAQPGVAITASSEEGADEVGKAKGKTNFAPMAFDGRSETRWCAADDSPNQQLTVDFDPARPDVLLGVGSTGKVIPIRYLSVEFEKPVENYKFHIEVSEDGKNWRTVCVHDRFEGAETTFETTFSDDFCCVGAIRIVFDELKDGFWASIREFVVSEKIPESAEKPEYYAVIDKYRLRWEDVVYEPGTLEAVAYREGKEIGREVVRTAGDPAKLRLTPEKSAFESGDDLIYVLVESVDKDGTVCPLDDRIVSVSIDGPAELVGIANGNSIGMDGFTDTSHSLFYGKAMIVLRSRPAAPSDSVRLTVTSEGVEPAETTLVGPSEMQGK